MDCDADQDRVTTGASELSSAQGLAGALPRPQTGRGGAAADERLLCARVLSGYPGGGVRR